MESSVIMHGKNHFMIQLTDDKIRALMPLLRLSLVKRYFILINGAVGSIARCQVLWGLPTPDPYPKFRLNWFMGGDGITKSGYANEEEFAPDVNALCAWLETQSLPDDGPTPEITTIAGWKIYMDGYPIGTKLDFQHTKNSKFFFPEEFYSSFPVFFTKEDCLEVLKKQIRYMLDNLKLKRHYSSLREDVANRLEGLGYI